MGYVKNMDYMQDMSDCRKRIIIITNDGRTLRSEWFYDNTEIAKNCVNCTIKELAMRNQLMAKNNITIEDVEHWCCPYERGKDVLYVSKHAIKRLKERNGWNRKNIERMVRKIYEKGIDIRTLPKDERMWVMEMRHTEDYETDNVYKLYGKFVYVFRQNTLITVLNVPTAKTKMYK